MKKTPEEIAELKREWEADPIWDIEDTEEFEEYKDELLAYRLETQKQWEDKRFKELFEFAEGLRLEGHMDLAEYLQNLERRIAKLEASA